PRWPAPTVAPRPSRKAVPLLREPSASVLPLSLASAVTSCAELECLPAADPREPCQVPRIGTDEHDRPDQAGVDTPRGEPVMDTVVLERSAHDENLAIAKTAQGLAHDVVRQEEIEVLDVDPELGDHAPLGIVVEVRGDVDTFEALDS